MEIWTQFWIWLFIAAVILFLALAITVTIGGLFDIRTLFRNLRARHNRDSNHPGRH